MEWFPAAEDAYLKKLETWRKKEQAHQRRLAAGRARVSDNEPAPRPVRRMLENEPKLLLNLAAAVKLMFARSLLVADFERAKGLLENFLYGFLQVSPCSLSDI